MSRQQRRAAERQHKNFTPFTAPVAESPVSQTRLDANRANAQLSSGPVSAEGKATSSQNAFKHGAYSKRLIMPGEDAAALDALKADLRAENQPVNLTEEILVNEMAEQFWRLRRARLLEAKLLQGDFKLTHLSSVMRLMSSAERGFHKALKVLRELQKQRGFVPQTSQMKQPAVVLQESIEDEQAGFVPQKDTDSPAEMPATIAAPVNRDTLVRTVVSYAELEHTNSATR